MKRNWSHGRRVRQSVQAFFFVLFVALLFAGLQHRDAGLEAHSWAGWFFRANPLSALAVTLAGRRWLPGFAWALLVLGLTLLLGRVWCGWICPTGTLLEWVSFRSARRRAKAISPRWRSIKYVLLALILIMALLGNLSLLVFEPLALLTRTMTTAVIPGLNYAINAGAHALYAVPFLQPAVDWFESSVRGSVLPVRQPAFRGALPIAALFFGVVALNLLADRFWCRYLCPLGALLGWLSKVSLLRPLIGSACTGCTRCALACKPGAIKAATSGGVQAEKSETDAQNQPAASARSPFSIEIMPSECTVCLDCLASCSKDSLGVQPVLKPAPAQDFDLSRRQFLQAAAAGAAGLLLLRTDLRLRTKNARLIRPPGAQDEAAFLAQCVRCTQCMEVCPTTALQPALVEAGLEGFWTPVMVPRAGYCDYGCNACGQVCPSGAIPLLDLAEKRQQVLGKASVDRNRCLPWASATTCVVCEEMCPTPEKAIRLQTVDAVNEWGEPIGLQQPYVIGDLCIGCGICENHCPLEGEAGIRVYAV
ncbi:MAG: 4Fe-4S binding protein [Chloroflexota bacterium]